MNFYYTIFPDKTAKVYASEMNRLDFSRRVTGYKFVVGPFSSDEDATKHAENVGYRVMREVERV